MRGFFSNRTLSTFFILVLSIALSAQSNNSHSSWADSTLETMSIRQKVAQMMMIPAYSNKGQGHIDFLLRQIEEYEVGGFIFFQGGPVRQVNIINKLQSKTKLPLIIGMDAEWGPSMRIDSVTRFPWAMTLGAVSDTSLVYKLGEEMAFQCRSIGVHWNFAPVFDLNTNPDNPIINARSFGEEEQLALPKALALAKGMEDNGVLSCMKHFPGHGDTKSDSHKTLPTINKSREELEKVELLPFRKAVGHGISSTMIAHLNVPALTGNTAPTSMSRAVVTDLLRTEMNFNGLIVTDALNMSGAGDNLPAGEVELNAFLAGNDILLFPRSVEKGIDKIVAATMSNISLLDQLNASVLRILKAKERLGLSEVQRIETEGLVEKLNRNKGKWLNDKLAEEAITVLINREKELPWSPSNQKVALVRCGKGIDENLVEELRFFSETDVFDLTESNANAILKKISLYDRVMVAYYTDGSSPWKSYKPESYIRSFVQRLSLQNEFVLGLLSNPYALDDFPEALNAKSLLLAYQNMLSTEKALVKTVFGANGARGNLSVRSGAVFPAGSGIPTSALNILRTGYAEDVGMNEGKLNRIDNMIDSAISSGAMPGAQVLIARRGQIVYNKSFGKHTYSGSRIVKSTDLYDIASITKIASTTLSIMKMYEDGYISLDDELGDLLPMTKGTNKEKIVLREMLAHQAGLQAWIPFYIKTMAGKHPKESLYRHSPEEAYSTPVADDLYILDSYRDSIYNRIIESKLLSSRDYKYSDLGYYLLMQIIQDHYNMTLDEFVESNFYNSLGLQRLTYLPVNKFDRDEIVPTEEDTYFRNQLVHGFVHDQGSAMLGGVGGHAGLFSNALDLARLMQMLLNEGTYGGNRYLQASTIKEFTRCQYCEDENRRGVGFDKPQLEGDGPTCGCVSMLSYGHTGFTGTMAWVDPEDEIVYIFLSNRINPSAENTKLIRSGLRTRIQEVIYKSIYQ